MPQEPQNLEQLIDDIYTAGEGEEDVTLDDVLDEVGHRSFGPLLLVAGLIMVSPVIGDIPGMPTAMGSIIFLTTSQVLLHQDHIWLPGWLLERSVSRDKLFKGLEWMEKPARYMDRWIQPRMQWLVHNAGGHAMAVVCLLIAVTTPLMEVVPFVANGAGAAVTAFGLAYVAEDGLLALIAFLITGLTAGLSIYYFVL